ncbi:phosphopantetheine-binding protein, partial [Kitasatospora sp. NPDC036755]|uniref:phosphopantetheine-binding protein n=1 Tax=Kitasatospora sp. NPDC036755 TaxID=3154600 RepID=UPI0033C1C065
PLLLASVPRRLNASQRAQQPGLDRRRVQIGLALHGLGRAAEAAADAHLDALAAERRAAGAPALALALGPWDAGRPADEALHARMARFGTPVLTDREALALFDAALGTGEPALAALHLDRAALRARAGEPVGPLAGLLGTQGTAAAADAEGARLVRRLLKLPAAEREGALLALVRRHVADVLGLAAPEAVEPDRAFQELGFDSLAAVELRRRLEAATGLRLPATLVFDHPNALATAGLLAVSITPVEADPAALLLDDIDRLEAALHALGDADAAHPRIAARLDALARRWHDAGGPAADGADAVRDTEFASDDELFDILDGELGAL